MDVTAVLLVTATVFVWGTVSARLERADLTGPIVFVAIGGALAAFGLVDMPSAPETLRPLVEVTLVWVLFSDAARVPLGGLRRTAGKDARLLGIGMPLTLLAGWGLASWLFPELDIWLALLVAAALAPTDAALGVPVVTNPVVPSRVRRMLTVESGLNDGIATPVVLLALAGAASAEGLAARPGVGEALVELLLGVVVGGAIGYAGGWVLQRARRGGWAVEDFVGVAVLALAIAAYLGAVAAHGNGFVAAFCGGVAFGATAGRRGEAELVFLEQTSGLASLLVWLSFGVVAIPIMFDDLNAMAVLYAVLSLTVVRMVPVALALVRAGLSRATVLFVGWFGPRGLASLVFALLALEELGSQADEAMTIIAVTVFLSVLLHGFSAAPLAARYGAAVHAGAPEHLPGGAEIPVRGLPRAGSGGAHAAGRHGRSRTTSAADSAGSDRDEAGAE